METTWLTLSKAFFSSFSFRGLLVVLTTVVFVDLYWSMLKAWVRFAWHNLGLVLILALLYGFIYQEVGEDYGIPALFWNEDKLNQFYAGMASTMLVGLLLILAFYKESFRKEPNPPGPFWDAMGQLRGSGWPWKPWRWIDAHRLATSNFYRLSVYFKMVGTPLLVYLAIPALWPAGSGGPLINPDVGVERYWYIWLAGIVAGVAIVAVIIIMSIILFDYVMVRIFSTLVETDANPDDPDNDDALSASLTTTGVLTLAAYIVMAWPCYGIVTAAFAICRPAGTGRRDLLGPVLRGPGERAAHPAVRDRASSGVDRCHPGIVLAAGVRGEPSPVFLPLPGSQLRAGRSGQPLLSVHAGGPRIGRRSRRLRTGGLRCGLVRDGGRHRRARRLAGRTVGTESDARGGGGQWRRHPRGGLDGGRLEDAGGEVSRLFVPRPAGDGGIRRHGGAGLFVESVNPPGANAGDAPHAPGVLEQVVDVSSRDGLTRVAKQLVLRDLPRSFLPIELGSVADRGTELQQAWAPPTPGGPRLDVPLSSMADGEPPRMAALDRLQSDAGPGWAAIDHQQSRPRWLDPNPRRAD